MTQYGEKILICLSLKVQNLVATVNQQCPCTAAKDAYFIFVNTTPPLYFMGEEGNEEQRNCF